MRMLSVFLIKKKEKEKRKEQEDRETKWRETLVSLREGELASGYLLKRNPRFTDRRRETSELESRDIH